MNKAGLVKFIQDGTGMTAEQSESALDALINAARDELAQGGDVRLTGFGAWSVQESAARTGRNPSTGKPINLPATKRVKFKPGSKLTAAVQMANQSV